MDDQVDVGSIELTNYSPEPDLFERPVRCVAQRGKAERARVAIGRLPITCAEQEKDGERRSRTE